MGQLMQKDSAVTLLFNEAENGTLICANLH